MKTHEPVKSARHRMAVAYCETRAKNKAMAALLFKKVRAAKTALIDNFWIA